MEVKRCPKCGAGMRVINENGDWLFLRSQHASVHTKLPEPIRDALISRTQRIEELERKLALAREFLLQWRELNPSPTSQLGVDTDSFMANITRAALRE